MNPQPESVLNPDTTHAWERWQWRWHIVFVALLAFCLLVHLASDQRANTAPVVVLLSILGGWSLMVSRARDTLLPREHPRFIAYFLAAWAVWYGLVLLDPTFFLLLFGFFPYVFIVMPLHWAMALAGLLNVLVLIQLNRIDNTLLATWMIVLSLALSIGSLMGYFIHAIIRQSRDRRSLIDKLENAQESLARMQHRAGALSERERVARELHDTVIQGLIGIITNLEAAEHTADNAESHTIYLTQAKTLARESLKEARAFIHDTRPDVFQDRALADAIRYVLDMWFARTPVQAELVITGMPFVLSQPIELMLLRVLQEALSNITRHAGARQVKVTLSYMDSELILDIHDDGVGMHSNLTHTHGFGLTNIRERVEHTGGTFIVESEADEGTTLVVILPTTALTPIEDAP